MAVPPPTHVPEPQKKGFAITALVLGIVAILGSWIPFLSIGSALIGAIGLVFGIIAVVKAFKGTAGGKVMAIIGSVLSGLAIIFAIVSTAAGVAAVDGAIDEVDEEFAAELSPEPATDASDEPAEGTNEEDEEVADEPEGSPEGTRDNPFPAGSVLTNDEVEVTLGTANWAADETVASENQFNDPAADGSTFVILPVTITNVASSEPVTPWLELTVFYVAPDGRSFQEASAVIPEDVMDIDDLYEGGTGSGNLLYEIPSEVQEGGVWGVEMGWFSDTVFVEAT
ncbi:DUF4190 domain-containing protein [Demequina muriae]|uniref:DUF4190 domain-containing protein n=1 Tax=Demequina muriae TaxID=3051664 RepID=A0ABT8GGD9_9MICO|nr:DUF4190 domain-containing protein [Demequina sp. EGI L300058]MDN4480508.1 DUF4190 domain-containing protein [Demequina sp. EGI L300058]